MLFAFRFRPLRLRSSVSAQTLVYPTHPRRRRLQRHDTRRFCTQGQMDFLPPEANPSLRLEHSVHLNLGASRASASRVAAAEPITRRIEFPRARSNLIFCRRRPTPRYNLKVPYFPNCQHLPPTREPPRSGGGGSNYTTYRNPVSGLNFDFLPPEANTPLRLHKNICPQMIGSPAHLRAAA
ncbi:hypothetical protein C8R43DRAFT_1241132 [Mycena crocata]|nr:hypothetical protein C8R43DRAFT_1241132 [Mycena crocata]